MTAKMNADNRYAGLICKNPFNSQWRTLELHHSLFSLDDLAKNLDLSQKPEPRTARHTKMSPSAAEMTAYLPCYGFLLTAKSNNTATKSPA
jgi:hypothetical protein